LSHLLGIRLSLSSHYYIGKTVFEGMRKEDLHRILFSLLGIASIRSVLRSVCKVCPNFLAPLELGEYAKDTLTHVPLTRNMKTTNQAKRRKSEAYSSSPFIRIWHGLDAIAIPLLLAETTLVNALIVK